MEWLATLLIVLFVVLLVGGAFAAAGARGPWASIVWFFVILFLATWAIGSWIRPIGPQAWGVPWLTFLVAALFIALLIAAATPGGAYGSSRPRELPLQRDTSTEPRADMRRETPAEPESTTEAAATAVGVFVWVFLVVAGSLVLLGLLFAA